MQNITHKKNSTFGKTLALSITLVRIPIAFLMLILFHYKNHSVIYMKLIFILFILGMLSDFFDGYFARLLKCTTTFGGIMDQVCDKILVQITILILIYGYFSQTVATGSLYSYVGEKWYFPLTLSLSIIVARDLLVSGLRMSNSTKGTQKIAITAKAKTAVTMIALSVLLFATIWIRKDYIKTLCHISLTIITLASFLSAYTGIIYYVRTRRQH